MNAASSGPVFAAIGSEAVWQTNPVFCIDGLLERWNASDAGWARSPDHLTRLIERLKRRGIALPAGAIRRWIDEGHLASDAVAANAQPIAPRVAGLAVHGEQKTGFVFPLQPTVTDGRWNIDSQLPFSPDDVLDVLVELLKAGRADAQGVPERLAFRFENRTRLTARGESMTVAAALAALDCLTEYTQPLLRAAAVLVKMASDGALEAVGEVSAKLRAANRECGELSLLVSAPDTQIDRGMSKVVWQVSSIADLARHLHAEGLLGALLAAAGPLSRTEVMRVLERLSWLTKSEHRHRDAAELGDRVRRCEFAKPVDTAAVVEFDSVYAAACRHNGRFADAVSIAADAHQRVKALVTLASDDEEADAAAEHAACLFSAHRFAEISPLLSVWAERAHSEPRRFRPLTRVKLWNTLARALAICGEQDWEELFARSEALQRQLGDGENLARTTHDRIHALLRHGDLVRATRALEETDWSAQSTTVPWLPFLRADLARREHRVCSEGALDERLVVGEQPYSAWLYLQATARQGPRPACDAIDRLERAIALLHHESGGIKGNVCNLFAAMLELAIAARSADTGRWDTAVAAIEQFLATADEHRQYYGSAIEALPVSPDTAAVERLLNLVPYF